MKRSNTEEHEKRKYANKLIILLHLYSPVRDNW
jgi:hypothetical protein